jgi:hypothetical protein
MKLPLSPNAPFFPPWIRVVASIAFSTAGAVYFIVDLFVAEFPCFGHPYHDMAAARILSCCAIDLMSEDKGVVLKAVETLNEVWTEPPFLPERIPFMMYLAADIAGEMETALFRLPYLSLLRSYGRPCRPPVD